MKLCPPHDWDGPGHCPICFSAEASTDVFQQRKRAEQLRDQVFKTWSPPIAGRGSDATIAQTAVMVTLAWVFGRREFFTALTLEQHVAIETGLDMFTKVLSNE